MAAVELGTIEEIEGWTTPNQPPLFARIVAGLRNFARRKPLGAVCGLVVLFFLIVGDLVPETVNSASKHAGLGQPVPYLADVLVENVSFIHPYERTRLNARLQGSSSEHLLGTDSSGRDVLSRLLYGSRTAVMISFGAVIISGVIQVLISVPAGYFGGWYDKIMYRFVDVVDALPTLILLIAIFGVFGTGLWPMILVMGVLFGFGGRYLRGQTISIVTNPYIEAARAVGASDIRIMMRYVVPNIMPLIIIGASLRLGVIVLLEASLSFLGFGIPPPFPSWGQMLSLEGREFMRAQPGLVIYPGLAIGLLVFSFNLLGDAIRDVMDPRLRGNR